jgi:hypothetical protein
MGHGVGCERLGPLAGADVLRKLAKRLGDVLAWLSVWLLDKAEDKDAADTPVGGDGSE